MDYRDSEGYFQEDVLRVLGRSHRAVSTEGRMYRRVGGDNFVDSESSSEGTGDTQSVDSDGEWEEAKRVLYMSVVGVLLPMVCRYIGRRVTFTMWARMLTSYFSRR
ncbi:hypothetical protein GGI02_003721 [Coemansia sp. RSA 2322]|nr:hypothetical protein GGI02_003721 [Coemansia sp. RSA 2322]